MSWLGKIVGGTIGFALGGPLGAVAGAAFGHGFDRNEQQYLEGDAQTPKNLSYNEEAQLTFFVSAFSMLSKIAKADGRVSEQEIKIIDNFIINELGLNSQSADIARNIFREAKRSDKRFEDFAQQFFLQFQNQPRIIHLMMDVLVRVSAADGYIQENEESLLKSASYIFKFSTSDYNHLISRYINENDKHYSTLGITSQSSDEDIKKSYRKLVQEYHPDKIESKGLPEEFKKVAIEKFRQIQEAYEYVKKERHMK